LAIDAWNEVALEYHARVEKFTSQFLPFLLNRNFLIENDVEQLDDVRYLYGMNVLDVAAGTGAAALYAVSKGAQVTATDFSEEMLKIAQIRSRDTSFDESSTSGNFESRLADGENLPMQWTDKFDIACSNFGVIYFSDMNKGLEEMVRCTKPYLLHSTIIFTVMIMMSTISTQMKGRAISTCIVSIQRRKPSSSQVSL
jgi:ubiquinone/menaquinone biosynthesis C-methylase UbiE